MAERDAVAIAIRAAEATDAEALGRIAQRAWGRTYPGIVPDAVLKEWIELAPESWRKALTAEPLDDAARVWVAERGGTVRGYATTSPARDVWLTPPAGAGELTNLYIDPDAIGSGLGHALFQHAVDDLHDREFNPLVVWAFRDNPLARRFYERMGLTIDVADHHWVLGDVPCPIVRFRRDWSADATE